MTHIQGTFLAGAIALAALSVPSSAQATLQGLGTSIPNLTVTDMSPDGSALVATDGSSIYVWTTGNPTFTLASSGGGWDCRVSNGGAYISSTRPDPVTGNDTPARLDVSTGQWLFLGGLGGQSGTSIGSAYDINGDGQVVVGLGWISATNAHAFRWDPINGMIDLGTLQGGSDSRANGVSADGATVVGWDSDPNTGVWRAARWDNGVESLIGCLNPADPINGPSHAYAASSNGAYITGESSTGLITPQNWNEDHAFRWDAINGLIDLGTTPVDPTGWGNHDTLPAGISDDGRTTVGIAGIGPFGRSPYISREGSGVTKLKDYLVALGVPQASAWTFIDVQGISGDGRVICGSGTNPSAVREAYRIELAPLATAYCTAKVNSQGCTPSISGTGIASMTSGLPFTVGASNVLNNKNGLMYYGFSPLAGPFQGGFKCVASPSIRTPLQLSGGSTSGDDCTGTYAFDFNVLIQSGDPMLTVGTLIYCQYWSRDPATLSTTGLTDGLSFTIFP
jgi:probable HAF family extracellular repeat protein